MNESTVTITLTPKQAELLLTIVGNALNNFERVPLEDLGELLDMRDSIEAQIGGS